MPQAALSFSTVSNCDFSQRWNCCDGILVTAGVAIAAGIAGLPTAAKEHNFVVVTIVRGNATVVFIEHGSDFWMAVVDQEVPPGIRRILRWRDAIRQECVRIIPDLGPKPRWAVADGMRRVGDLHLDRNVVCGRLGRGGRAKDRIVMPDYLLPTGPIEILVHANVIVILHQSRVPRIAGHYPRHQIRLVVQVEATEEDAIHVTIGLK